MILYYTDFFTLMSHFLQFTRIFYQIGKYRVIIVSKPKISCNIVWTQKKDIAEGGIRAWIHPQLLFKVHLEQALMYIPLFLQLLKCDEL